MSESAAPPLRAAARGSAPGVFILTAVAMIAFAANSILCRLALRDTAIDAATFTTLRLVSGAFMLALLVFVRTRAPPRAGNWRSAAALFAYAAAFSFAYVGLSAGTGALLLFAAVQATMVVFALWSGERLVALQCVGFGLALAGLIALLLPGLGAPPVVNAALMLCAGIAWGAYSIRGRGCADPAGETAANFLRCVPMTAALSAVFWSHGSFDRFGALCAVLSGAVTSGLGYTVWYAALRGLSGTAAAVVQLSVPALAALGGVMLLGEAPGWRLVLSSAAILGGIAMVITIRR